MSMTRIRVTANTRFQYELTPPASIARMQFVVLDNLVIEWYTRARSRQFYCLVTTGRRFSTRGVDPERSRRADLRALLFLGGAS